MGNVTALHHKLKFEALQSASKGQENAFKDFWRQKKICYIYPGRERSFKAQIISASKTIPFEALWSASNSIPFEALFTASNSIS